VGDVRVSIEASTVEPRPPLCMARLIHWHGVSVCLEREGHEQHGGICEMCEADGEYAWLVWDEDGEDWTRKR
jgi:hypothetical protein